MELRDAVARRRMVRAYSGEAVAPEVLARVLDTARRAPSAGFAQGVSFVVVTEAGARAALAAVCGEPQAVARGLPRWISTAPVLVVPCVREADYRKRYAEPDKRGSRGPDGWTVPWHWVDAGQSLMLLLLAAVDTGLAAGLLDVADPDALRATLGIPADVAPLGVVTLGHPAPDQPSMSTSARLGRRPPDEVVHRERW